ncbi:hypothetical protein Lal_00032687 [Lupinus albus]|nr:hypothetical protein Lal_00032687 [Lupinus albus]
MKVDAALSWCVAKFSASPKVLEKQLDYACRNGADCAAIKSGGSQGFMQFCWRSIDFHHGS